MPCDVAQAGDGSGVGRAIGSGWLCRLTLSLLVSLASLPVMGETLFRDDFNRPDGTTLGNGWTPLPHHNSCPVDGGGEAGDRRFQSG
ncbi:MAG: hypothetical protein HQM02_04685 [Magnetococcales bacterium]|nr:hypothetical protein [Magnetococcales bacterium]